MPSTQGGSQDPEEECQMGSGLSGGKRVKVLKIEPTQEGHVSSLPEPKTSSGKGKTRGTSPADA